MRTYYKSILSWIFSLITFYIINTFIALCSGTLGSYSLRDRYMHWRFVSFHIKDGSMFNVCSYRPRVEIRIKKQFKMQRNTLFCYHYSSIQWFFCILADDLHITRGPTICFNLNSEILFKSIVFLSRFIGLRIWK